MTKKPAEIGTRIVTVFSVSPIEEDHLSLNQVLTGCKETNHKFNVEAIPTLASALAGLQKSRIPIVVIRRHGDDWLAAAPFVRSWRLRAPRAAL
jgi:hypothetical protein